MRQEILANASLNLDFANRQATVGSDPADITSAFTFARASIAEGSPSGSTVKTYAADAPRLVRQGGVSGLLVERARDNLLVYGSDLAQAAWTKGNGAQAVGNSAQGLDGLATASVCTDTAAVGSPAGFWAQTRAIPATNQWVGAEIYVRRSNGRYLSLSIAMVGGTTALGGTVIVDLRAAVLMSVSGPTVLGRVEPAGEGMVRIQVAIQNTTGNTAAVIQIQRRSNSDVPVVFTVDRASMFYGSQAPSSIKTGATAFTRAAETVTVSSFQKDWFNGGQGTMFFEGWMQGGVEVDHVLFHARNAAGEFLEIASEGSSQKLKALAFAAGAVTAYGELPGVRQAPMLVRAALRYTAGSWSYAASGLFFPTDGVFPSTSTLVAATQGTGAVPNVSEIQIGHRQGGSQFDGVVRQFAYFPYALNQIDLDVLLHV